MTPLPLDIAVKATLLLAGAGIADALLGRRASAAARHMIWSTAIAALLVLPIAAAALPQWTLRIPVAGASAPVTSADPIPRTGCDPAGLKACAPAADTTAPLKTDEAGAYVGEDTRSAFIPSLALVALYLAGALLLLARLAVESFALGRLTRDAHAVTEAAWTGMLEDATRELRVTSRVRLLRSAREIMPLTFGTLTPAIVLPASADRWTDDRRRAVLLHELAHVARRDCFVQRLTAVACAFYWPHPGVWWAARRLRVERELACDDRVLAAGAGAREYAGHLLDLAHTLGSAPAPATALGMARARQLERRLLAVLDSARNRAALQTRARTIGAAIAIGILVPLAAVRAAVVPAAIAPGDTASIVDASSAAPQQTTDQDLAGTWELRLSRDPGMAQVTVRTAHGNHGRSIRLDQIPGISPDQISATAANVHVPIRREAGTFDIEGVCRRGVCGGTLVFEPNQTFATELTRRGLARPTPQQQMDLALADVGVAYLDALKAAGYATPDLATIVRAAQHGVDAVYLREMTELGYRLGTLDALTTLRDHGVDPSYVRGMAASGYSHLTVDQLLQARDHGVDPNYVRGMRDLGYRATDLAALITTRDHGVDPNYVRGMQDHGYRLSVEEATRTRDHGVDPAYVDGLAKLGYGKLTVDELLRARDHGVDPNYVREMSDLGYKGVPLESLIRMRDHGVDPTYVRRLQQRGAGHLSVDEIIERRDRGSDDPDAAARAIAYHAHYLWQSLVTWLRS